MVTGWVMNFEGDKTALRFMIQFRDTPDDFAVNTTEATEMVAAARRNHRFLMEAMWTWFIPGNVELKRRIADGAIGKVLD